MTSSTLNDAVALWHQGQPEAAAAVSAQLVDQSSDNAELAVFHGGLLLHLRRYQDALDWLTEAARRHPDNASLLANLSVARRYCGQLNEAVEAADQALAQAPDLLAAWNALLLALVSADQLDRARTELALAMELHPGAASLQHLRGQLAEKDGPSARQPDSATAMRLLDEARRLVSAGSLGPAEATFRQALAVEPDSMRARLGLGELLLRLERPQEAARELAAVVRQMPSHARSRHLLAVASGTAPPVASTEYVRELFDGMAETFDDHLQERLGYTVPEEMAGYLLDLVGYDLGEVLDLGCGTGLLGERIAGNSRAIDGVDLSARMLLQARKKGCYRELHLAEMVDLLRDGGRQWQTITAADVFIYHGKLDELLVHVHMALHREGCFAFSVESIDEGDGFDVDMASGRYQHSKAYLDSVLQAAGFDAVRYFDTTIRQESGRPIPGWIVLARRAEEAS